MKNFAYKLGFNAESKEVLLKAKCLNKEMTEEEFNKSFEELRKRAWEAFQQLRPQL